jgi:hypothetical protein
MRQKFRLVVLLAASLSLSQAQDARNAPLPPDPPHREWRAFWITHPAAPQRDPVVLHFRRLLQLATAPSTYPVRVSADNRFILYVNGRRVGDGPARSDLSHWRYERFDLAPYLNAGENVVAAVVWNFGAQSPIAQMSDRTAFLLESEASADSSISTPGGWQVALDSGRKPLGADSISIKQYVAAGAGEQVDASGTDWSWMEPKSSTSEWVNPADPMRESVFPGSNRAHSSDATGDNPWWLVEDYLPHMAFDETSPGTVVRGRLPALHVIEDGDPKIASSIDRPPFPAGPALIPPHTSIHLLLDRKTLTTAYPELTVSGGKGAKILLTYSEALYDNKLQKADRDTVNDRRALGFTDVFLPDGGLHRSFQPLWWRTWRYLSIDITTADKALKLESLKAYFTAYPFEERGSFESPDADLDKIWEISWRTARLDAHETYMDTPYWEQLQYIGDTRIQALISYSVGDDDRLARQALEAFNHSRIPEGITRSRYPSSLPQNIPTFSLLWIGMLHDWWMYRPDPKPVIDSLEGTRSVLAWFARFEQADGLLEKIPWWSFIDWVSKGEIPTYSKDAESCVTTLQYLGALQEAADLEQAFGDESLAQGYRGRAAHVRSGLQTRCWVPERGLLADNPDHTVFSQQANTLGVLFDVIPGDRQREVLRRMISIDPGTTPDGILSSSYYFRFYLARALDHAGMADEYLKSLDPWRALLPLHFSTWPETPGSTRSDSHAWSAHPAYDLLTLVAGIKPASPAFQTVRVDPHPGSLTEFSATYPHSEGLIHMNWTRSGTQIRVKIELPGKLSGEFAFQGHRSSLSPGTNEILLDGTP